MLSHFTDKGQYSGTDHHMVDHIRVSGDLGEITGEGSFSRWDRDLCCDRSAVFLCGFHRVVTVIVTERIVGINHGDLLPKIAKHPF